jgi:anti-sigma factor ChrR (cupin superfamily)
MMGLPSCQEVGASMTDYMEGALPLHKRLGIRIHLMMCDLCSGLYRRLDALSRHAKEMFVPPTTAPAPEAKAALEGALAAIKKDHRGHGH